MYFDWVTWSIWLLGFVILVVWIVIPVREFKQMMNARKKGENKRVNNENV